MSQINWNQAYLDISPKLLGICRRYISDIATAEDIVQDSFIVAMQKENTLKDKKALPGWLGRITINMAIHHLKENKKVNFINAEDYDFVDQSTLMTAIELDTKSALLASDIDRDDILEAIDSLPEHHKAVFNMYVIDQFSHAEIGKVLNISVGTSKSNLSRARKFIQGFLFEKLKEKTVDEKKKRRLALLIFFGFGDKMMANFYRKSFANFEIRPAGDFSPKNRKVVESAAFAALNPNAAASKTAWIGGSVFVALLLLLFFGGDFKKQSVPAGKKEIIVTGGKVQARKIVSNPGQSKSPPDAAKLNFLQAIKPTSGKTNALNQAPVRKSQTAGVTTDSAQAEREVVIIKKQIVKRDTIYAEK